MANIEEFNKKINISIGAIALWTSMLVSATFTLSTIYWNFTALQDRTDKRHERLILADNDIKERILHLEEIYNKSEVKELKMNLESAAANNTTLTNQLNKMEESLNNIEHER